MELPGLALSKGGSILAASVGSRRNPVSGRQLNADPLGSEMTFADNAPQKERTILPYVLIYAAVVLTLTVTIGFAVETFHLRRPSFIMLSIIPIGAWAASRLFAKRERRHFNSPEFWRIVLLSCLIQLVPEGFGFLIMAEMGTTPGEIAGIVVFALVVNLGFVYLSYRYVGRRTISKVLAA